MVGVVATRRETILLRLGQVGTAVTIVCVAFWSACGRAAWNRDLDGVCDGRSNLLFVFELTCVALAVTGLVPRQNRTTLVRGIVTVVVSAVVLAYSLIVGLHHFKGFLI